MMAMARWRKLDAGAVQCSLSWFKSRPGLQPSLAPPASARQASRTHQHTPRLDPVVGLPRRSPKGEGGKSPLMARFWGLRGRGIWSKDHPRARVTRALGLGDARHARPFFVPNFQSES